MNNSAGTHKSYIHDTATWTSTLSASFQTTLLHLVCTQAAASLTKNPISSSSSSSFSSSSSATSSTLLPVGRSQDWLSSLNSALEEWKKKEKKRKERKKNMKTCEAEEIPWERRDAELGPSTETPSQNKSRRWKHFSQIRYLEKMASIEFRNISQRCGSKISCALLPLYNS